MKSLLNADLEKIDREERNLYRATTVMLVLVTPAILGTLFRPLAHVWLATGILAMVLVGPTHSLGLPAFFLTLAITYLALSGLLWAGMAYFSRRHPRLR